MRNWLVICLLFIGFLISGVFVVDERQVAVVKKSATKLLIYASGIHWNLPFSAKVNLIYTNLRASYLSMVLPLNTEQINLRLIINWQVRNPAVYSDYINSHSQKELNILLAQFIMNNVRNLAINVSSVADLENRLNNKAHNLDLPIAGISIIDIGLMNAALLDNASALDESFNKVHESALSTSNLESAYYTAQKIKNAADLYQREQFNKLRSKNPEFYHYFMQIQKYQNIAKTRQDVPPLRVIYPN